MCAYVTSGETEEKCDNQHSPQKLIFKGISSVNLNEKAEKCIFRLLAPAAAWKWKKDIRRTLFAEEAKEEKGDFGLSCAESGGWWNMLLCGPWGPAETSRWYDEHTHMHTQQNQINLIVQHLNEWALHSSAHTVMLEYTRVTWWCTGRRMDYRGRGSGVKEKMGKEGERNRRAEAGRERDSKPITIGLEKAFHPKTVTTHANIHTSLLSPAYKYSNTHGQTCLFIAHSHTHIQSSLQTNALLIKYWGVPVANRAEIQFLSSLVELPFYGRRRKECQRKGERRRRGENTAVWEIEAQREGEDEEEWREGRGKSWETSWAAMKRQERRDWERKARTAILKWSRNNDTIWQLRSCIKEQKKGSHHERADAVLCTLR